jgi:ectoine hydroxylase-related dioxygenase (phytanoyl-CoA dioxygenase family)
MTTDLADHHQPITHLFPQTLSTEQQAAYALTDEQIAFYHEQGYLSGIRVLTDEQVRALREELAEFVKAEHAGRELWYEYHSNESTAPDTVLFHALGAWRIGRAFHDVLWNPAFTIPAKQLLGGPVRFWHDQLFCKPARHGGVVAWHQDYSYWTRTQPMAHLTCWIGLDDSDDANGCVQYIPGSHRWDLLPITGLAGDMNAIQEVLNERQWEQFNAPVSAEVKAGYATFHHPLMVHGSRDNRTDRPRRATVINVVRDGVCSQSDQPLLDGTDAIPPGEPLGGKFYPLLLD